MMAGYLVVEKVAGTAGRMVDPMAVMTVAKSLLMTDA